MEDLLNEVRSMPSTAEPERPCAHPDMFGKPCRAQPAEPTMHEQQRQGFAASCAQRGERQAVQPVASSEPNAPPNEDRDVEMLQLRVKNQARELTAIRLKLEEKNRALDAMHWVWCSGGCDSGVHRWHGGKSTLTEELVALAERNTRRLREKLGRAAPRVDIGNGSVEAASGGRDIFSFFDRDVTFDDWSGNAERWRDSAIRLAWELHSVLTKPGHVVHGHGVLARRITEWAEKRGLTGAAEPGSEPATTAEPSLTERVERLERTLAETVASVEYLSGKVPDAHGDNEKLAAELSQAIESLVVAHIEGAVRCASAKVGGLAGAALEALAVELGR